MRQAIQSAFERWREPPIYKFHVAALDEIDLGRIASEGGPGFECCGFFTIKTRSGWRVHVRVTRNSKVWRKP
jgi:hypothetical protein